MSAIGSILTLNAGSSSLKFALFDDLVEPRATIRGEIVDADGASRLSARDASGAIVAESKWASTGADPFVAGIATLLQFIDSHLGEGGLAAAGHRVVQGGADHISPEAVTPALLAALTALAPLDPLHMPSTLAAMRLLAADRPALAQVACFDTAFHHTLPVVETRFALPREISDAGVRRYGFHGLSCEYIAGHLMRTSPELATGRVIVAHLGSGASLCAIKNGASIATTTGFSALEGLVMATRCGSLDPGVLLYLGSQGRSFADIEDILYKRSGLLGVSGVSGDVRVLLDSSDPRAQEALDLFAYRIVLEIGAMASALGGLDGLIFTAGIGERAPTVREAVCGRLAWLGLELDNVANALDAIRISTPQSKIDVRVIPTDEEAMIVHHTQATIRRQAAA
jgi:acetate kinase